MMRRSTRWLMLLLIAMIAPVIGIAYAQDAGENERSRFVRFVEEQISSPNMQIRLIGLEGTLSRNVSLDRITISDEDGVWLTIEEPRFRWDRSALLRRNLIIEELSAQSLTFPRPPRGDESLPDPEARAFTLPQLPVSIRIDTIDLPSAEFGEPVFGLASTLSVDGSLLLDDGTLDADLDITRLDAAGGQLALDVAVAGDELDMDVRLQEPADGVLANLVNIPDRPPVALSLTGGGPVDALDIDLAFDVDGARILDGSVTTSRRLIGGGTRARFDLQGPLADILPEGERAFFGERTDLAGVILFADNGTIIEEITLESGALSGRVAGRLLPDGFPENLDMRAALTATEGRQVTLPGSPRTTIAGAEIALDYSDANWRLTSALEQLSTPDLSLARLTVDGSGTVSDLRDPANRSGTYELALAAQGYASTDPGLARAVGTEPEATLNGRWGADRPLAIDALEARVRAATVTGQGILQGLGFAGRLDAAAPDLALLSELADRDLAGSARARLTGRIDPLSGAFNLMVDAAAADLAAGDDLAGRLLAGDLTVTGGVERSVEGLAFEALEGSNAALDFAVNGTLASDSANLNAALMLADLALIDERSSGAIGAQVSVTRPPPPDDETSQPPEPYSVLATLVLPEGRLAGQPARSVRVAFEGEMLDDAVRGDVSGSGTIAGAPLALDAEIDRDSESTALDGLALSVGDARLSGGLELTDGLVDGALAIDADDISRLAALALVDASGRVTGDIALAAQDDRQDANVDLTAQSLRYNDIRIGSATITAELTDLFGAIGGSADVTARTIRTGGLVVETLDASAETEADETIGFEADARLSGGIGVDTVGTARRTGDGFNVGLARFAADTPYGDARLAGPTTIVVEDGTARTDELTLLVEGGRVTLSGAAGAERLDLDATLSSLPLSIANAFRPALGAGGTLSGTAQITGTPQDPRVAFGLDAGAVTAAVLQQAGVAPFAASATGSLEGDRVQITRFSASNPQGLDLTASGAVPLSGAGLDLSVSGSAPLALAEAALAGRGIQLDGTARFEGRATGSLGSPAVTGLVSVSGGRIVDPLANIELTGVSVLAGLEGDRLVLRNASAELGGGGIAVTGQIGLASPFPADLSIEMAGVRYTDGRIVTADLGADLAVSGPLAGGALISGSVDLARVEITVPDGFGAGDELLDVQHIEPGAGTLATLRRIGTLAGDGDGGAPRAPFRLDLDISAPNQVFVRGRGLDVELGGRLRLTGSLANIVPVGGFDLIRGRLSVLNQRIDFTSGRLTLAGDLDPFVNLVAEVSTGDLLVTLRIVGPASDLELELSSTPDLPEDEIFAQLLFGSDIASLSPIQIARLADAATALAGGGTGLTGGLRSALGVDDLDIVGDGDGGIGVRAGRYLTDNVYLELESAGGDTETSINLDITDSLTARGSAGTDGDTSLGIFFERDY